MPLAGSAKPVAATAFWRRRSCRRTKGPDDAAMPANRELLYVPFTTCRDSSVVSRAGLPSTSCGVMAGASALSRVNAWMKACEGPTDRRP